MGFGALIIGVIGMIIKNIIPDFISFKIEKPEYIFSSSLLLIGGRAAVSAAKPSIKKWLKTYSQIQN